MKRISAYIFYSVSAEISQFVFSFFLGVLTARFLGAAGKGKFWLVYNIAGLLALFLSMRFHRSLTYHLSKNRDLLGEIILYGLMLGAVTVSSIIVVTTIFPGLLFGILLKGVSIHWAVLVLLSLSHYLWLMIIGIIEGLFLFKAKTFFLGGTFLVKCVLVFVALGILRMNFESLILFMGCVETFILMGIILYFFMKADHYIIKISSFLKMVKYSMQGFLSMVSDLSTLRLDVFLVNYFSGPAHVGVYSVAISLASILLYLPTAVRNVLLPYIASYPNREITAKLAKMLMIMMIFLMFIIIPLGWIGIIPIYGDEFSFSRVLFLILLPGALFFGIFSLLSSDIEGRGAPGRVSRIAVIGAGVSIGLGLIFIPFWNSLGAAVVSSIMSGLMMVLSCRIYRRMLGVSMTELLIPQKADLIFLFRTANCFILNMKERLWPNFIAKRSRI